MIIVVHSIIEANMTPPLIVLILNRICLSRSKVVFPGTMSGYFLIYVIILEAKAFLPSLVSFKGYCVSQPTAQTQAIFRIGHDNLCSESHRSFRPSTVYIWAKTVIIFVCQVTIFLFLKTQSQPIV